VHLLVVVLAAGACVGRLRGGRLARLADVRFRASGLLFAALGVQLSLGRLPGALRLPSILLSYAAVGLWIKCNLGQWRRPLRVAMAVIAAGWALNLAAIVPHGGMPVAADALAAVGAPSGYDVEAGHLYKHVAAGPETGGVGRWLGDSIPVAPLHAVVSMGDLLLAAGLAGFVASAMRGSVSPRSSDVRVAAG
jgi:hypothetical protein